MRIATGEAPTRDYHPAVRRARSAPAVMEEKEPPIAIPRDQEHALLEIGGKRVSLTNLSKPFWPELGLTKRDLMQYYADVSPVLLPHLRDGAMVMKRYPNGAAGEF